MFENLSCDLAFYVAFEQILPLGLNFQLSMIVVSFDHG
jgi:hypothetical protein